MCFYENDKKRSKDSTISKEEEGKEAIAIWRQVLVVSGRRCRITRWSKTKVEENKSKNRFGKC